MVILWFGQFCSVLRGLKQKEPWTRFPFYVLNSLTGILRQKETVEFWAWKARWKIVDPPVATVIALRASLTAGELFTCLLSGFLHWNTGSMRAGAVSCSRLNPRWPGQGPIHVRHSINICGVNKRVHELMGIGEGKGASSKCPIV